MLQFRRTCCSSSKKGDETTLNSLEALSSLREEKQSSKMKQIHNLSSSTQHSPPRPPIFQSSVNLGFTTVC